MKVKYGYSKYDVSRQRTVCAICSKGIATGRTTVWYERHPTSEAPKDWTSVSLQYGHEKCLFSPHPEFSGKVLLITIHGYPNSYELGADVTVVSNSEAGKTATVGHPLDQASSSNASKESLDNDLQSYLPDIDATVATYANEMDPASFSLSKTWGNIISNMRATGARVFIFGPNVSEESAVELVSKVYEATNGLPTNDYRHIPSNKVTVVGPDETKP